MKTKLFKSSIGIISLVVPATIVVSCGTHIEGTQEQRKLYKDLTSSQALKVLENRWMTKILNLETTAQSPHHLFDKDNKFRPGIKELVKKYIKFKIDKDSNYLWNIGEKMTNFSITKKESTLPIVSTDKNVNVYNHAWLEKNGILIRYNPNVPIFSPKKPGDPTNKFLTDKGLKLLLTDDRINFKDDFLKFMIIIKYLGTDGEKWKRAFPEEAANLANDAEKGTQFNHYVPNEQFVLIKQALFKRYFAQWEVKLDKDDSNSIGEDLHTYAKAYEALGETGIFTKKAKYTERKNQASKEIFDFTLGDDSINPNSQLYAFKGFKTLSKGKDNLRFTLESDKQVTSIDGWSGFINKDHFYSNKNNVEKVIRYREPETLTSSLKYVYGILPTFNSAIQKFNFKSTRTTEDNKYLKEIKQLFALLDDSLYSEAKKFYTTNTAGIGKPSNVVILKITNEGYRKILEDKFNIDFTKERKAE